MMSALKKTQNFNKSSHQIILLKLQKDGMPFWHYISISKVKLPLIKKSNDNQMDVSKLGEILFSGWGENPPISIKNKIKEMQA